MTTFEAPPSEAALRDLRQISPYPGDEGIDRPRSP